MKTKTKAPSSSVRKKKKTPVAKRPVSKPAKGRVAKKKTTPPRKQRKKRSSSSTSANVPPPSVDSAAAAAKPDDATQSDAVATPPVAPPPVSKHKWRNRFFIFILILVIGMLLKTVIFPGAAAATGDTNAADGKKDVLPNGSTSVVTTGKASWMIWMDVIVMLIAGSTLAWAWMTGGEMWETEEFRRRFESKDERDKREAAEVQKARADGSDPTHKNSLKRDFDHEALVHRGPAP